MAGSGITSAIEEAGQPVGSDLRERVETAGGVQLTLLADAAEAAEDLGRFVPVEKRGERTGPGRPKGSRNRTTKQTVKVIQALGGDGLMGLAKVVQLGPEGVRDAYGLPMAEAFTQWRLCCSEIAPYIHAKAVPLKDDGTPLIPVNLMYLVGDTAAPAIDPTRTIDHVTSPVISVPYEDEAEEVTRAEGHTHDPSA